MSAIIIICIGLYKYTAQKIYIFDLSGHQQNITAYYNTKLFYIYTDVNDYTMESLIRKTLPEFINSRILSDRLATNTITIKAENKALLQQIINNEPDFSEKMHYQNSLITKSAHLYDQYRGFFQINQQNYTIDCYLERNSVESVQKNIIDSIIVMIRPGIHQPATSYEEKLKQAAHPLLAAIKFLFRDLPFSHH